MPGASAFEMLTAALTDVSTALQTFSNTPACLVHQRQLLDGAAQSASKALQDIVAILGSTHAEQRVPVISPDNSSIMISPVSSSLPSLPSAADIPEAPALGRSPATHLGKYVVENLIGHRGPLTKRSKLQFNVKWLTFDTPSWRSWSQVRSLNALREYLNANPELHSLLALLPTEPTPTVACTSIAFGQSALEQRVPTVQRANFHRHGKRKTKLSPKHVSKKAQAIYASNCSVALAKEIDDLIIANKSNGALNLTPDGKPLTYRLAKSLDPDTWIEAEGIEIRKLLTTETINPIFRNQQPMDRRNDTTYYNPQVREKPLPDGGKTCRVRGTAGGDRINYPGETAARTADMEVVKALLQSTLADDAEFMTIDITDFHLNTPLERKEYIRIQTKFIPEDIMIEFNLHQFVQDGSILFEINKGMYGLPQAGLLAQTRLIKHLETRGYHQTPLVPCLFKHESNGINFTLVVDDFGIKYKTKDAANHLIATLQELYKITIDWSGKKYLGMMVEFDGNKSVSLSLPGYVAKALQRFRPNVSTQAASPALYTPPSYGAKAQYVEPDSNELPLDAKQVKRIQEVTGVFLYYARAVDHTMLPAAAAISSEQAHGTQRLLQQVERLLDYATAYPNNKLTFHKSDMQLVI